MSKKTDYKFKCIDKDNFLLIYYIEAKSMMFNLFWNKAIKKLKKKQIEMDENFKDNIDAFNTKAIEIPDKMKTLFEGQMRRPIKKLLNGISDRANLVFYSWWFDDALYEKQDNKDWKIKLTFKGNYSRK